MLIQNPANRRKIEHTRFKNVDIRIFPFHLASFSWVFYWKNHISHYRFQFGWLAVKNEERNIIQRYYLSLLLSLSLSLSTLCFIYMAISFDSFFIKCLQFRILYLFSFVYPDQLSKLKFGCNRSHQTNTNNKYAPPKAILHYWLKCLIFNFNDFRLFAIFRRCMCYFPPTSV